MEIQFHKKVKNNKRNSSCSVCRIDLGQPIDVMPPQGRLKYEVGNDAWDEFFFSGNGD